MGEAKAASGVFAHESSGSDFDSRYPPDKVGEELSPNARIWRLYKDRATTEDDKRMRIWNGTIDQLLLFVRW